MEPLTLKKMTHQEDKTKGPLERGRNSVGANTKMKEEEAVSGLIQRRKKKKRCQAKRKKKEEETLSGGRRKKKRCGREMKSDSYRQVTLAFYIKMVKDILVLLLTLLGAQSNRL